MAEVNRMERMIHIVIFAAILANMADTAPVETDVDDMEEEEDRSIAEEVITYDDSEPSDPEIETTREKRYFDNFLERQSTEERRQRIHHLKQKNMREQRRRREQRKKKLRRNGRKKMRVNRNTSVKCMTHSPSHVVKLLLLIHSQKVRERVAGQWLRDCSGDTGGSGPRRSIRASSVRYFG